MFLKHLLAIIAKYGVLIRESSGLYFGIVGDVYEQNNITNKFPCK